MVRSIHWQRVFVRLNAFLCLSLFMISCNDTTDGLQENTVSEVEKNYSTFLEEHPFRETTRMSKEERLEKKLPPNKYYEQEWLYTSDPQLLRPTPERVLELQKRLKNDPGMLAPVGDPTNAWEERGPDNVGGRTHTLMFAPGSTTKVFAGGVSGGLWVNNNITSASSVWERVNGVPGNMAVMCITVDPNDSNIMYLGTGEVYTWGAVNGNGIYKSVDGGLNWTNIYSGFGTAIGDRITYVQDIIAWNNPQTNQTEIFFGADAMAYTEEVTSGSGGAGWNWLGSNTIGLYRSTDGENFTRLTGGLYESSSGNFYAPNDFDIDASGNLWMGTKYSYYTGEGGGVVFKNDGNGWAFVRDLGDNGRVELACSKQSANKIYALCEDRTSTTNPVKIYRTTNGFSTSPTSLPQPNDADTGISSTDFTRGQSFYDLMIGVDPLNDAIVYVGGIDLFKSTNSGNSWSQFSHWYGGFGYQEVHADQHGIAFATQTGSSTSRLVFGNDGGVYYTNNGGTTTSARNNGYNVTQFYKAAINQPTSTTKLLAGAQDNGSQLVNGAASGVNSATEVTGGDGCWAFIDQDSQYMISSYVYNNYRYITYGGSYLGNFPNSDNTGDFVNQCGLDSDTNILLSNATNGTTYQIYRWAINPSGPSIARTTLTNAMLNTIPTFFVASPHTSNRFLVGTALGKIIRLNNVSGTPTWTDISIPGQVGAVSDIRYGASENDIMVTFHNYGVTSIWYTSNGASGSPTWVSKEGNLPDMPVKCILQNPLNTNEVIVGTELGVWKTSDWSSASPTWVQSQNGMSDVKVLSFDYRSADNTILAATFGRGMFTGQFETESCGAYTTFSSGSWNNGTPSATKAAIIYDDYDTAVNGNLEACRLRITEGKTVTVRAGEYLKIEGDIINDGTLIVEHEGSVVQVDNSAIVSNNGTIQVKVTTPNLASRDFIVMGSPVSGEDRNDVWDSAFLVLDHNTANFVPNPDVEAALPGAENFADDNYDNWSAYTGAITPGEGYIVRPQAGYGQPGGIFNYTYDSGTLNNGVVNFPIVYNTPGPTSTENRNASPNILANPYPSAIHADDFITANPMVSEVYFWEHLTPPSPGIPGAGAMNFDMQDISMYNLMGGTPAANDTGTSTTPNGLISTGQGFGIKATQSGTAVFNNAMRRTTGNNTLRGPITTNRDRLWLRIDQAEHELQSIALIGFSDQTTPGWDDGYDSRRLATVLSIFSHLEDGSQQLGIQSRETLNQDMEIPIGFSSLLQGFFQYKITLEAFEGLNLENTNVLLLDNQTGIITDLKEDSYAFTSNPGNFYGRFTLLFRKNPVLEIPGLTKNAVAIYPNPTTKELNLSSNDNVIKSVAIYDILGKKIFYTEVDVHFLQVDVSEWQSAVYIVQVETEKGTVIERFVKK